MQCFAHGLSMDKKENEEAIVNNYFKELDEKNQY